METACREAGPPETRPLQHASAGFLDVGAGPFLQPLTCNHLLPAAISAAPCLAPHGGEGGLP